MTLITQIILYLCICFLYRRQQLDYLFALKILQTLKASKHRSEISKKIKLIKNKCKWFLFWPVLDIYEWYENRQENRNRNIES